MDPGYPKPITIWRGVPDSPQGAFVDKANGTICPVRCSDLAALHASRARRHRFQPVTGTRQTGELKQSSIDFKPAPLTTLRLGESRAPEM